MKLIPTIIRTAALTVILASAASAQAGLVNGRFTAGLTGWQTVGDASVQAPLNWTPLITPPRPSKGRQLVRPPW